MACAYPDLLPVIIGIGWSGGDSTMYSRSKSGVISGRQRSAVIFSDGSCMRSDENA